MVLGVVVVPGAPDTLLCHPTHRTAQILAYAILPACFGLFVHILQTVADTCLAVQLYKADEPIWASVTLVLILAPSLFGCVFVLSQPGNWPGTAAGNASYLCVQGVYHVLLFPIAAVHRYCRRIFWSMEALYVEDTGLERTKCLRRATEPSPLELYHFLQGFIQGAVQCLFQIYLVLGDDAFRDYDIVKLQLVSIFASLLRLSMTSALYQRFHSQKLAGRHYPWDQTCPEEVDSGPNNATREEPNNVVLLSHRQISEEALLPDTLKTLGEQDLVYKKSMQIPSDNFLNNLDGQKEIKWNDKSTSTSGDGAEDQSPGNYTDFSNCEYVNLADCGTGQVHNGPPMTPAPKKPVDDIPYSVLVRLSTVRDQLRYSAGVMFDDLLGRRDSDYDYDDDDCPPAPTRALPPPPVGLRRDDAASYTVCTIGWFFYLSSRFVSVGTALAFYPFASLIVLLLTYLAFCAIYVRVAVKLRDYRKGYESLFLGYFSLFVLLELKFKFEDPRRCFGWYFLACSLQTWAMAFSWYFWGDWESWWFEYAFGVIVGGTLLSVLCAGVYFAVLKPKEQICN